jgi:hypothetical protein
MRHMLARVGWKPDFIEKSVPILPISGWMGDNLIKKSEKMGWWSGMDVKTVDNRTVHVNTLLDVSRDLCCAGWGCACVFGSLGTGEAEIVGCVGVSGAARLQLNVSSVAGCAQSRVRLPRHQPHC